MFEVELINLEHRIEVLKKYLLEKIYEQDWHAVSDAANDIRVLDSKLWVYKKLGENHGQDSKACEGICSVQKKTKRKNKRD